MTSFRVESQSPDQTVQIAEVLAKHLEPGDAVLLTGELAAGKTTFVKAVAAALGSPDLVTSPTFTLAQFYATGRTPVLHIDAYRIGDLAEYRDLGLVDYTETSISLVEWGEKVAGDFPCFLSIRLQLDGEDPDRRVIDVSSSCDRWRAVLPDLQADLRTVAP